MKEQIITDIVSAESKLLEMSRSIGNSNSALKERYTFLELIVITASKLTRDIVSNWKPPGSEVGGAWLQSSLINRYLFELLANHALLTTKFKNDDVWEKFLTLRRLQIFADNTYGIALESLPSATLNHIRKNSRANIYKGWNRGDDQIKENLKDSIKLESTAFKFHDPWAMSFVQKCDLIDVKYRAYVLNRWKMYTQISHASSFSLWPTWIDPEPIYDAIHCLALILKGSYNHFNAPFNEKIFITTQFNQLQRHLDFLKEKKNYK